MNFDRAARSVFKLKPAWNPKYVERNFDQIGFKQAPAKKTMPRKTGYKKRARSTAVTRKPAKKKRRTINGIKTFKKATKIRTTPSHFAKRHYDDHGIIEREHCAYLAFQRHGSYERLWEILGEALLKALLAKVKFYPRSYDENLKFNVQSYDKLEIKFKRVTVPGGVDDSTSHQFDIDVNTTFETLAGLIATVLKDKATRNFDADTVVAYYPYAAIWYYSGGPSRYLAIDDLGESMVELHATQVITVKNMTKNDGGGDELDVNGVNPINGRKYEFNNFRPKLIDSLEQKHPQVSQMLLNVGTTDMAKGVNLCQFRTSTGTATPLPEDHILSTPPAPRQIFTNCVRAANVFIGPGGMKVEKTTFKVKHKFRTFVERIYYNQYDKGSFGGYTLFGLERTSKNSTDSRVRLTFDRALHMSGHVKLKTIKTMLKHYEQEKLNQSIDP